MPHYRCFHTEAARFTADWAAGLYSFSPFLFSSISPPFVSQFHEGAKSLFWSFGAIHYLQSASLQLQLDLGWDTNCLVSTRTIEGSNIPREVPIRRYSYTQAWFKLN